MKKMLVLLAVAATLAGTAAAQTPATPLPRAAGIGQGRAQLTPEQRADRQAQRLTTQLSLSADQAATVRAIALAQAQEMQTLRDKYAAADSRQGMGQELKTAQEKYDNQLKAVLTADQYSKYTQLREDRLDKVRQRRAN